MERKPGVAGGSKWTYEATFHIAMKGGREYYTTAARVLVLVNFFKPVQYLKLDSKAGAYPRGAPSHNPSKP